MSKTAPHYFLLTEFDYDPAQTEKGGRWRFVLESMNSDDRVEVSEREVDVWGERLQLLAVVRGVEALEQPSRLMLITASQLVGQRIRKGFDRWIENEWRWERFGLMKPIANADLWKRIHAATLIHKIDCRVWQFARNRTHQNLASPRFLSPQPQAQQGPVEFEETHPLPPTSPVGPTPASHDPRFVPTRTGWTRVTEIDPDSSSQLSFPHLFSGALN